MMRAKNSRPNQQFKLSLESLERREMLHGGAVLPTVRLNTNFGTIPIEMLEENAPGTVDNFLTYIDDSDFINSIFHRLVPDFVLQGGGFRSSSETICTTAPCNTVNVSASLFDSVPTDPPIVNEFDVTNARGTVAMAKTAVSPDTATSQFFVNLKDNAGPPASLDTQNGGFTVFGRVTDMKVVDDIAALPTLNLSSIFPPSSPLSAIAGVPISGNRIPRVESITGDAVIRGTIYLDNNGDGAKSSSELGMAGRTVFLDTNNNTVLDAGEPTTSTDHHGGYAFRVTPGDYIVRADSATDFKRTLVIGRYDTSMQLGRSIDNLDFGLKYEGTSWTNPLNSLDVDATEGVALRDAIQIINEVRLHSISNPQGVLPNLTTTPSAPVFYDVNSDTLVALSDAVAVINFVALSQSGAVEPASSLTVYWLNDAEQLPEATTSVAVVDMAAFSDDSAASRNATENANARSTYVVTPMTKAERAPLSHQPNRAALIDAALVDLDRVD